MITYLLTDFDGVIAPIASSPHEKAWPERESRELMESHGATHSFYVYPEMLKRLTVLFKKNTVMPFWLSTWKGETAALNTMLGFNLEEAGEPEFPHPDFSWKEQMVISAYEEGVHLIWIEDEPSPSMLQWIEQESDPKRILCIIPNSYWGMTPDDMEKIEAFIHEVDKIR